MEYFGNVYISQKPICDDGWSLPEAKVICRSLGRSKNVVAKSFGSSKWGNTDSSVFALDDVGCKGDERFITDCPYRPIDDCSKSEGAGVVCFEPDSVFLSHGYGDREGFVMAMNRPVSVAKKQWGYVESQVVCNRLYGSSFPSKKNVPVFKTALRKVPQSMGQKCVISDVKCSGNEKGIEHCLYDVVTQCPSSHGSVIVACALCADKDLISILEQSLYLSGSRKDRYNAVVGQLDQLKTKCRDWYRSNGGKWGTYPEFFKVKDFLEDWKSILGETHNSSFMFYGSKLNYSRLLDQDLVKRKFSSVMVDITSLGQQNSIFRMSSHFKNLSQYYAAKIQEVTSSTLANSTGSTEYLAKAKLSKKMAEQFSLLLNQYKLSGDFFEQRFIQIGSAFLLREQKRRLIEEACAEIAHTKGGVEEPFCTHLKWDNDMDLTKLINY